MEPKIYHLNDLINETETKKKTAKSDESVEEQIVETITTTEEIKEETINTGVVTPNSVAGIQTDGEIKAANVSDLKPMKPKELSPEKKFEKEEMKLIDKAIDRVKNEQMIPLINDFKEACQNVKLRKEMEGTLELESHEITVSDEAVKNDNSDAIRDHTEVKINNNENFEENLRNAPNVELDNEIKDEEDESETTKETDSSLDNEAEERKRQEEEKIKYNETSRKIADFINADSVIDLSSFSISKNPISINKAVNYVKEKTKNEYMYQSVPLFNTGRTIEFTPLTGSEIVSMSPDNYNSQLDVLKKSFTIMYDHDVTKGKPNTFTKWLRSIDAGDLNQLYFGLYKATFADANYISYQCPKCHSFFMTNKSMDDMCTPDKNMNASQKDRLEKIIKHGSVDDDFNGKSELYAISKKYAVVIKPKSLYNLIEPLYVDDEKFNQAYLGVIQMAAYIGNIYYINLQNNELTPIDIKSDMDSIAKTFRNKCTVLNRLIHSITADEYAMLNGKILNMGIRETEGSSIFTYQIPECACEGEFTEGDAKGTKCTHTIEKEEMTPLSMLFTRHQLVTRSTLRVD